MSFAIVRTSRWVMVRFRSSKKAKPILTAHFIFRCASTLLYRYQSPWRGVTMVTWLFIVTCTQRWLTPWKEPRTWLSFVSSSTGILWGSRYVYLLDLSFLSCLSTPVLYNFVWGWGRVKWSYTQWGGGGGGWGVLFALAAFLPSVISSLLTQNKRGARGTGPLP